MRTTTQHVARLLGEALGSVDLEHLRASLVVQLAELDERVASDDLAWTTDGKTLVDRSLVTAILARLPEAA